MDFMLIPVMGLLNRIRGGMLKSWVSGGAWIAAVGLGLMVFVLTGNVWASLLMVPAFILGENFGWTKYINTVPGVLTQRAYNTKWANVDTDFVSYPWDRVASMFVDPRESYERHTNIGMALRGAVFIGPCMGVLCGFGLMPMWYAIPGLVVGSVAFPMTYKWAYGMTMFSWRYLQKAETMYGLVFGAIMAFGLAIGV